jgi:hypothetical protein
VRLDLAGLVLRQERAVHLMFYWLRATLPRLLRPAHGLRLEVPAALAAEPALGGRRHGLEGARVIARWSPAS